MKGPPARLAHTAPWAPDGRDTLNFEVLIEVRAEPPSVNTSDLECLTPLGSVRNFLDVGCTGADNRLLIVPERALSALWFHGTVPQISID